MDDEAALIARLVAMAAAAWSNAPADIEVYRGLASAVDEWNVYCAPELGDPPSGEEELLDELADHRPAVPVGSEAGDLAAMLRQRAREVL